MKHVRPSTPLKAEEQSPILATAGRGNVFALAERAARNAGGCCALCGRALDRFDEYRVGHRPAEMPPIAVGACCWDQLPIWWISGRDLPSHAPGGAR
jgi:hypothetical protein